MRTKEEILNDINADLDSDIEALRLEILIDIRDQLRAVVYYLAKLKY